MSGLKNGIYLATLSFKRSTSLLLSPDNINYDHKFKRRFTDFSFKYNGSLYPPR